MACPICGAHTHWANQCPKKPKAGPAVSQVHGGTPVGPNHRLGPAATPDDGGLIAPKGECRYCDRRREYARNKMREKRKKT